MADTISDSLVKFERIGQSGLLVGVNGEGIIHYLFFLYHFILFFSSSIVLLVFLSSYIIYNFIIL